MEHYLYLILDIVSFSVPFLFSFETKHLNFIRYWRSYIGAISIVALVFIIWDVWFTMQGVWGFNPRYLIGIDILHLPIEEWLFFLLIPYSSNFIHYSLNYLFPKPRLKPSVANRLSLLLFIISFAIAVGNYDRLYTLCSFGTFSLLLLLQYKYKWILFERYILSFLIILIPFFIVNSWLTGSFTDEPVVWYNNAENLSIRVGTIPVEDFFYCFTMLYSSALIFEKISKINDYSSKKFRNIST